MKVRVSVVRCADYRRERVEECLRKALGLLGGIGAFVRSGSRVLLKPNLLSARAPDEAVTTHPEFVRVVGMLVKEAGGIVSIGDSPGSFFTVKSIDEVFEKTGMKRVADEEGFGLIRFDKVLHLEGYPIAKAARDYDLIINLPKMKTHTLAILTGAVKNTFGFMPGLNKVQCHKRAPNIKEFSNTLVDIFSITRPGLSIMDGIVGMDKDGPAAGRIRGFGLILASPDAVGLDAVFSYAAGLAYERNSVLKAATERGLGKGRLEDLEVVGEDLRSVRIKDFKFPRTELPHLLPSWLGRPLAGLINFRPVIDERACKKCGLCRQSCPADAVTINKRISEIDEIKCVRCFCCHEVCPYDAIYIKKNIIAKMLWQ